MLGGPILHRALALGGESVVRLEIHSHAGKGLGCHRLSVLLIPIRSIPRQAKIGGELCAASRSHKLIERLFPAVSETVYPVMSIAIEQITMDRVTRPDG